MRRAPRDSRLSRICCPFRCLSERTASVTMATRPPRRSKPATARRTQYSVATPKTFLCYEQSTRHSLGSPAILVLNYQWESAITRGLFALSLPYSVSTKSEQPPTEKVSEPFFLSSITRYILLASILSRRKTPMRISCTTSKWTFATRCNPHRFEECHAALCHRAVLPSAHRRSKLTIGNVREPSWLSSSLSLVLLLLSATRPH